MNTNEIIKRLPLHRRKAIEMRANTLITDEYNRQYDDVARACLWIMQRSKGKNMMAHVHALMHVNPKIAKMNGFPSLRSSAKHCGCSTEYIRRLRNRYKEEFKL